ncbi:hypothetical protein B0H15DRAFT_957828 [Mycena belliarum]|uniref:F-box domain-containing protein n=1 Tax=Mycena belliarum TaxID=1033014 RepID=A0AAD6XE03_9AGAR|nr:hypothetical protein B0H15DRAFT_957828 [Mycena belliae]
MQSPSSSLRAIDRLPPELIGMINILSYTSPITLPSLPPGPPIVCISQVCRRWRFIAHDQSFLWTTYFLGLPPSYPTPRCDALLRSLEMFVAHSGSRELIFNVVQADEGVGRDVLAHILMLYSPRIQNLQLHIPQETAASVAQVSVTPLYVPHLEVLEINFRLLQTLFWEYLTAPELTTLHIASLSDHDSDEWDNRCFMDFLRRSDFSLARLSLAFDFSSHAEGITEVLRASPTLIELHLRWTGLFMAPDPCITHLLTQLASPLFLPNLASIAIDATAESLSALRARCIAQATEPGSRVGKLLLCAKPPFPETLFAAEIAALRGMGVLTVLQPMDFFGAMALWRAMNEDPNYR